MKSKEERYVIAVPNEEFDGYRFGIKFSEGRAVVYSRDVRDALVIDHGYSDITPAVPDKD